jgi:hypothetical protein
VPPRSLFRSTSFRLVAWYAAVFGASVVILLAFVYWITLATVDQQIHDSVEREMTVLVEIYTNRGLESTERAIQRRLSDLKSPRRYLLLQDSTGRRLGGNLPAMTPLGLERDGGAARRVYSACQWRGADSARTAAQKW